jgi:enoyl-CoA hydratase
MHPMTELDYQLAARAATITINRADKKNALTLAMWARLQTLIQQAQSEARVLLIRSAGDDFCAGADIAELQAHIQDHHWMTENHQQVQRTLQSLATCSIPSIAVIHGACFGGGVGIAAACDFRIASVHAKFALTPAKLGLAYSIADCKRLVDLIGIARSKEMLYTGNALPAVQALTFGLIHQMHAVNTIDQAVRTLVEQLLAASGLSISTIKHHLQRMSAGSVEDDADSRAEFAALFQSADFAEGAAAFLQRRVARFG